MNSTLLDNFILSVISSRANAMCRRATIYQMKFNRYFVTDLLDNVTEIFMKEPTLLNLTSDITVVGDIHGNIDDLIRFFTTNGYPPETKYLFLGDYVDRGANSVEVVLLLFALKLKYPDRIYLLRGNHECEALTAQYGFRTEASNRVDKETYFLFTNTFKYLPLAALVNKKIFCVHGGISQYIRRVEEIKGFQKALKIPQGGPVCDLLWADPRDGIQDYYPSDRKVSYYYGWKAAKKFMNENNLKLIVRAHEAISNGHKWSYNNAPGMKKKVLTIFSNSEYSSESNSASVLRIDNTGNYTIINYERAHCGPIGYPTWMPENKTQKVAFRMITKSEEDSYESFEAFFDSFYGEPEEEPEEYVKKPLFSDDDEDL